MKIQLGDILMNRTFKYLLPCIKSYGEDFVSHFNKPFKIAIGIGDMVLIRSNIYYEKHLFVLLDSKATPLHFRDFIDWIKDQPMYEDDYAFDNLHEGHLHMVVIKMPESCYKPLEQFKRSQFSQMFTIQQVEQYFVDNPHQRVLVKDHDYKIEYTKHLNELFETDINPNELEGELDFPIRKEDEFFNLKDKKNGNH